MPATSTCTSCDSPKHFARGLCQRCYDKARRSAPFDSVTALRLPPKDRLLNKLVPGWGGCLIFTGGVNAEGYGQISIGRSGKVRAHRFAYEIFIGDIPSGLVLDHLCRVRRCCNPWHLEPVTDRENILRGVSPSALAARKTHCPQGHPYYDANTHVSPDGRRHCRACRRARDADREPRRVAKLRAARAERPALGHCDRRKYRAGGRCAECRAANASYQRVLKVSLKARLGDAEISHGLGGYTNWGCRCEVCRGAASQAWASRSPGNPAA